MSEEEAAGTAETSATVFKNTGCHITQGATSQKIKHHVHHHENLQSYKQLAYLSQNVSSFEAFSCVAFEFNKPIAYLFARWHLNYCRKEIVIDIGIDIPGSY